MNQIDTAPIVVIVIITHTQSAKGQRRVYLGGKSSVECYIEPKADGIAWSFHLDNAVTGVQLSPMEKRDWAIHTLLELAYALEVAPETLARVSFEEISALHDGDPFAGRRVASSKRKAVEHGFLATAPNISQPRSEFEPNRAWHSRSRS